VRTRLFDPRAIALIESAASFEDAISQSVSLLISAGHAKHDYVTRVLSNYQALGAYFVVAPGIAIAHAHPGDDVLRAGLSLLKVNQPVVSGAVENDPVSLVFSLCTPDSEQHIELLGEFASLMSNSQTVNSLLNASAESVIREILSF
jgi:ascorbate PTS system EIIA or EIIAB component